MELMEDNIPLLVSGVSSKLILKQKVSFSMRHLTPRALSTGHLGLRRSRNSNDFDRLAECRDTITLLLLDVNLVRLKPPAAHIS